MVCCFSYAGDVLFLWRQRLERSLVLLGRRWTRRTRCFGCDDLDFQAVPGTERGQRAVGGVQGYLQVEIGIAGRERRQFEPRVRLAGYADRACRGSVVVSVGRVAAGHIGMEGDFLALACR